MTRLFVSRKHRLDNSLHLFRSCKYACCPLSHSTEISLSRTYNGNCHEWSKSLQSWGCKDGILSEFLNSQPTFRLSKAYGFCWPSDVELLWCELCMDGWLFWIHSHALNQAAPLPCEQSTEMSVWRKVFIVTAIERPLAILPKDDTPISGRWVGGTASQTIPGRSHGWNHSRHLRECEMHLANDIYHTWYTSQTKSQHAWAFIGFGNILLQTIFRYQIYHPALCDDASISWLRIIQQAIELGVGSEL
jgi:hypothetical protein